MGAVNSRRRKRDKKGIKHLGTISQSPTSHSFDLDFHNREELRFLHTLYGSHLDMERSRDDGDLNRYPVPPENTLSGIDAHKSTMSLNRNFGHRITMGTAALVANRHSSNPPESLLRHQRLDENQPPSSESLIRPQRLDGTMSSLSEKPLREDASVPVLTTKEALRRRLNLDNHPVMTRLQNEQNSRLESMEQRMQRIRQSAQQELERRKFATLFKARTDESSHTEKLIKEASEALQLFKKQKLMKKSKDKTSASSDWSAETSLLYSGVMRGDSQDKEESDSGEIIPVRIVSDKSSMCVKKDRQAVTSVAEEEKLSWVLQPLEAFNLSGPVMWLLLPFLLPVLLILHLIRHFCRNSDTNTRKKN